MAIDIANLQVSSESQSQEELGTSIKWTNNSCLQKQINWLLVKGRHVPEQVMGTMKVHPLILAAVITYHTVLVN